jgi:radical SAM protein with 4Fe4S-binding SPASM domain
MQERAARKKIPFSCHFDLTYHCNLNCVHCYLVKEDRPELNTAEVKGILDQLAGAGTLYLSFSGGEIFTREDFFEIAGYARKLHFALRLLTNGTLIDEEAADRVAALNPDLVSISIYSATPEIHDEITTVSGSFARSVKAARMLIEKKIRVKLSCIIMRQNVGDYPKVYELAQRIGASFQADPRVTPRNDGDLFPLRFQINEDDLCRVLADPLFSLQPRDDPAGHHSNGIFDDLPCGAAHTAYYISPYGDVYPCTQFPFLCGNLKEKSFEGIWYHSPEMLKVRSITISQLPFCSRCDLLPYCNRCPGLAYLEEGDFLAPSKRACREARIKKECDYNT